MAAPRPDVLVVTAADIVGDVKLTATDIVGDVKLTATPLLAVEILSQSTSTSSSGQAGHGSRPNGTTPPGTTFATKSRSSSLHRGRSIWTGTSCTKGGSPLWRAPPAHGPSSRPAVRLQRRAGGATALLTPIRRSTWEVTDGLMETTVGQIPARQSSTITVSAQ